MPDTKYNTRTW